MPLFEVLFTENPPAKKGNQTLMDSIIEFPVNPALSPFLVSSLNGVMWVDKVSQNSMVRAAFRSITNLENEFLEQIVERGQKQQWGNIHTKTPQGCAQCLEHLRFFGFKFEDLQALTSEDIPWDLPVKIVKESWIPQDCIVFLPKDMTFVGSQVFLGETKAAAVIHNAGRGIAVAFGA